MRYIKIKKMRVTKEMREENKGKRMCLCYSKSPHSNDIGLYITNSSKKEKTMQNESVKEMYTKE